MAFRLKSSAIVHVVVASVYTGMALTVTVLLWGLGGAMGYPLGQTLGILVGVLVLLAGGLMHENYVRRRNQSRINKEITTLKEAYSTARAELDTLRKDVLRPPPQAVFGVQTRSVDAGELGGEVEELHKLLDTITRDRSPEAWEASLARANAAGQELTPEQKAARRALLGGLDERKVLAAIDDALRNDRLDLYLTPMVRLPSRRKVAFECSCRIRLPNGRSLTAEQYGLVAEDAGLMAHVQNLMLVRTVQLVRASLKRNMDYMFFCPISAHSLAERPFLLEFVRQMESAPGIAQRLIFGLAHQALPHLPDDSARALFRLGAAGFRFYLDQVQSLNIDLEDLSERRFRFAKFPAPLLLVHQQQTPGRDPRNLKRTLDRFGIDPIVSGLDEEGMLLDLLDFAIDFAMGDLFGETRPAVADPSLDEILAPEPQHPPIGVPVAAHKLRQMTEEDEAAHHAAKDASRP